MAQNLRKTPKTKGIAGASLLMSALFMAMPLAALGETTPTSCTLEGVSEITIDSSILDAVGISREMPA